MARTLARQRVVMKTHPSINQLIAEINAEMRLVECAMKLGMPRPLDWDDPHNPDDWSPYDRNVGKAPDA